MAIISMKNAIFMPENAEDRESAITEGISFVKESWTEHDEPSSIYLPKNIHIFAKKKINKVVFENGQVSYKEMEEICLIATTWFRFNVKNDTPRYAEKSSVIDIEGDYVFLFEKEGEETIITKRKIVGKGINEKPYINRISLGGCGGYREEESKVIDLMFLVDEYEKVEKSSVAIKNYGTIKIGRHGGIYCQIGKKVFLHKFWFQTDGDEEGNEINPTIMRLLLLEKLEREVIK